MENSDPFVVDDPPRLQFLLSNIQTFLTSWKELTLADIFFSRLTGFTNITYKVRITKACDIEPKILVYREFCAHEGFFSRSDEMYVFDTLGAQGLGPKNLGGDGKTFRLEEFIYGRHPDPKTMQDNKFTMAMAKYIENFHRQQMQKLDNKCRCEGLLNKERPYEDFWIVTEKFKGKLDGKDREMICSLQEFVTEREIEFLRQKTDEIKGKVVFCHNDFNANNIFLKDGGLNLKDSIVFIDLEYCHYNLRGYDIGNFFIERTFDYNNDQVPFFFHEPDKLPEEKTIVSFATLYVFFSKNNSREIQNEIELLDYSAEELIAFLVKHKIEVDRDEFLKEIELLCWEIKLGILFSLFYWLLWSGSICKDKNIKFDYLLHGICRKEAYLNLKERFF